MKTATACCRLTNLVILELLKGPSMMNVLHKSQTTTIIAASIFISGLNVDLVGAQDTAAGTVVS